LFLVEAIQILIDERKQRVTLQGANTGWKEIYEHSRSTDLVVAMTFTS